MTDLFSQNIPEHLVPLAERVRPDELKDIVGQDIFIGQGSGLIDGLKAGQLFNLILFGPPGTGKTTLAKTISKIARSQWINLNAVDSGVKDLKEAGERGRTAKHMEHRTTVLFVDEIHRFNRTQQDILLPFLEAGDLYLIGATTENPSYALNKALVSRCHILEFKKLLPEALKQIFSRSFNKLQINPNEILTEDAAEQLIMNSDGDARRLLNAVEALLANHSINSESKKFPMDKAELQNFLGKKLLSYDKKSDDHYNLISCFIKSMRGSDPDAALYYCARMLQGGEDPRFIARRMIIFASEDVGNAEPRALMLATACLQAVEAIGMPECRINLAQTICFLASSPKSNRSYVAINRAMEFTEKTGSAPVPDHLKSSGASGEYKYPHDFEKGYVQQNYWPPNLKKEKFYEPQNRGQEKIISEYLAWLQKDEPLARKDQ